LGYIKERNIENLSGGELQRFACATVCIQNADVYTFDEPSSYLDVKQSPNAAKALRSLLQATKYIVVVEHDLSVLDYLADSLCCLYGIPGVYGVVTVPFSVREGINIFLDGFVPTKNLRFREESLVVRIAESATDEEVKRMHHTSIQRWSGRLRRFQTHCHFSDFSSHSALKRRALRHEAVSHNFYPEVPKC